MPEQKIIAIDSQQLETIQLCPRKWYYTFMRQLTTQKTKDYFERGDLLHVMLAKYYDLQMKGFGRESAFSSATEEGVRHSAELNLSAEECEITIKNFMDYHYYYASDQWQPVFTERPAAKVLFADENFKFIYQGRMDLGVVIPGVEGITPVDHKSTKRRGTEMDLVNQFIGYCWLMDCFNLIKNEIGFQKTLKASERFRRPMFSYDKERIEEWVDNSVGWLKQLIYYIEAEKWPMNLSSCNKFDGCVYASLCSASPSAREYRISRDFKLREEKWDVGQVLELK